MIFHIQIVCEILVRGGGGNELRSLIACVPLVILYCFFGVKCICMHLCCYLLILSHYGIFSFDNVYDVSSYRFRRSSKFFFVYLIVLQDVFSCVIILRFQDEGVPLWLKDQESSKCFISMIMKKSQTSHS